MAGPSLRRDGVVSILDFGDNENRTGPDWLGAVNDALDVVEAVEGPSALVTTATGKFYSNGLDTDWMAANPDDIESYVGDVQKVLARILMFPAPTIAAINGHAFGAGAFLAIAHDYSAMRADRGFINWPEVHLGMPFTRGLTALLETKLSRRVAHEAIVVGPRYGADEAVAAHIVDQAVALDDLLPSAVEVATARSDAAGRNLAGIKRSLHYNAVETLRGGQ